MSQIGQLGHGLAESTGKEIGVPDGYTLRLADPNNTESAETRAEDALRAGDESFKTLFQFVALHHLKISSTDTSIAYAELLEAHPWWGKVVKDLSNSRTGAPYDELPVAPLTLFGKKLNFPIGFASTNLAGGFQHLAQFADSGFDLISTRTFRCDPDANQPHPAPNLAICSGEPIGEYSVDHRPVVRPTFDPTYRPNGKQPGLVHSIGAPGTSADDIERELKLIRSAINREGQLLSVNIFGDAHTSWRDLAVLAFKHGADAVELNISLPTVQESNGGMYFERPSKCADVVREVRSAVGTTAEGRYVAAKIGYLPPDQLREWFAACHESLDGIYAINGVKVSAVASQAESGSSAKPFFPDRDADLSVLSGPPILELALEVVRNLKQLRDEFGRSAADLPIIGSGGVSSYGQFAQMLEAGADVVQCCSGAWYEPELAAKIRRLHHEDTSEAIHASSTVLGKEHLEYSTSEEAKRRSKSVLRFLDALATGGLSERRYAPKNSK